MSKLLLPLLIVVLLCMTCHGADQIVVAAFQKIFKYATAATVKTLTANCNKAATNAKAKTVVKNWVPKNWKASTATLVASDPYSKQAYAQTKALAFIDYRWALKTYINYMKNQAVSSKYLTAAEGTKMTALFWAADTATENNYTLTCQKFAVEAAAALSGHTPSVLVQIQNYTAKFAAAKPAVYKKLGFAL